MPVVIVLKVLVLWGKGQAYLLLTSHATIIMNIHLWASYWSMGDQKLGQEFCLPRARSYCIAKESDEHYFVLKGHTPPKKLNTGVYLATLLEKANINYGHPVG